MQSRMQSVPPAGSVILWQKNHFQEQRQILKPVIRNPREVCLITSQTRI